MRYLILLLLIISCKDSDEPSISEPPSPPSQDTRESTLTFGQAIDNFEKKTEVFLNTTVDTSDISVNFGDTKQYGTNVVGVCIVYSGGNKEILIDESFWNNSDDTRRYILMSHELGHCYLDRVHKDSTYNGYPLSIMNTHLIGSAYYEAYEEELDEELATEDDTALRGVLGSGVLAQRGSTTEIIYQGNKIIICPITEDMF